MFAPTTVRKTGENKKLLRVLFSNGASIDCTPYHKFYVKNVYSEPAIEKRAAELQVGDKLIKSEYPIIDEREWIDFPHAYTHGFFCGDGTYGRSAPRLSLYGTKKEFVPYLDIRTGSHAEDASGRLNFQLPSDLPEKFTVPMQYSLKSRLEWFAGLVDADGTATQNGNASSIQIGSVNQGFLDEVRLMLQTMGVYSTVTIAQEERKTMLPDGHGGKNLFDCRVLYRLLVAHDGLVTLNKLGFKPKRVGMPSVTTQRRAEHFVQVVEVKDHGRKDDTYCFSEPIRHMGVFNGILTGQCTEITLNSSEDETAVCNLGSVNLMAHLEENPVIQESGDECFREDWPKDQLRTEMTREEALRHIDKKELGTTIHTAMRMLDNVIDLNFYPTKKARNANMRHRAVGLGIMGFADALHRLNIPMDCEAAVTFADVSQEVISFFAINSSFLYSGERGSYSSFRGSTWNRGLLPVDTLNHLRAQRTDASLIPDTGCALDPMMWGEMRKLVASGMRNSNVMAIAPTATISNIVGVSQGIDPIYQNLYVKSNLSGEFTVTDSQLVKALERLDLWDEVMVNDLKYFDGSLAHIDRVPAYLKRLYATAFEIDPKWLVKMAAVRQKWVDQSQSLNLYMAEPSGRKIDELYRMAWKSGLKTTYYLRTMGATSAEKSTVDRSTLNKVVSTASAPKACLLDDPTCEACQ